MAGALLTYARRELMTSAGTPEEVARAYDQFVGYAHPAGDAPVGFREWVMNLHDVYLNVQTAWLATIHVPPSDVEQVLQGVGGSRQQRLARFLSRDMWVLWEAWDKRVQFHAAFRERAPAAVARLDALVALGKSEGWLKHVHAIRDYMNHRDRRDYADAGRDELPDAAIEWLDDLRLAFSDLLLGAMGIPTPAWRFKETGTPQRNSSNREIAIGAVDALLIGSLAAVELGAQADGDAAALAADHSGLAFDRGRVRLSGSVE